MAFGTVQPSRTWQRGIATYIILLAVVALIYILGTAFYNIFFHPLRKYPGPLFARATRLRFTIATLRGIAAFDTERLHRRYGNVVRIAPNELSYISTPAWKDICGHRAGKLEMAKDHVFYDTISSGPLALPALRRQRHGEIRKLVSHSFSAAALKEQEPVIQGYTTLFIQKLKDDTDKGQKAVDMVKWYNFLTFDIVGDLVFGEPFGCLASTSYHPWVAVIFNAVKLSVWLQLPSYYPALRPLLKAVVPKSLVEARREHKQMTKERLQRRKERKTDHIDFMVKLLDPESGTNEAEQQSNAEILIGAGSETTATLLSGVTFLLLKNPSAMDKLIREVRSSFTSETEITFTAVNNLPYVLGCINEAFRLYPPVPGRLPRRVPKGGDDIDGSYVPEDTVVTMSQWAINRSPTKWHLPLEYHPERWTGDARFKNDDREALHPFSIGPRNCIGQNLAIVELRLVLARLLWNFDLELMPESEEWIERQKVYFLWEKIPLMVKLKPIVHN